MKNVFFLVSLLVFSATISGAYDHKKVHPLVNQNASYNAPFQAEFRAKMFPDDNGDPVFLGNSIEKWLRIGGEREDDGMRFNNHFHDPTQSWLWAGLKNSTMGKSSMYWSQKRSNDWSWCNARTYLLNALTHPYPEEREKNFALTFRAVGQVMHLMADASVPAHVRDDIHIFPLLDNATSSTPQLGSWTYETWCKHHSRELDLTPSAVPLDPKTLAPINGLVPISHLWDTTPTAGPNANPLGLAEYANRNFFSKDTVFKDYPQPQADGLYIDTIIENGESKERVYFKGTTTDGKGVNHLASTGYLYQELTAAFPNELNDSRFILDDQCFKDYAAILVPKAVGYSAALLDYFFRGDIEMVQDGSDYTIKNNSDETMTGTFTLYYDADNGQRNKVLGTEWTRTLAAGATSDPLTIEVPDDTDPEGQFVLAFEGELGNETGAVVGRVVEMKKTVAVRVVTVSPGSRYSEPGSVRIKMEDESYLRSALPDRELIRKIGSVRFDVRDWNRFVVLAEYKRDSLRVLEYHEFELDESNSSVTYVGKSKQRASYTYNRHETVLHELIDHGYCFEGGPEKEDEGQITRTVISERHIGNSAVSDFYFRDGTIKDLYTESNNSVRELSQYNIYRCNGADGPNKWGTGLSGFLETNQTTRLSFDEDIIDSISRMCTGGEYSQNEWDFEVSACSYTEDNAQERLASQYIFNKEDVSYSRREADGSQKYVVSFPYTSSPHPGSISKTYHSDSSDWISFYTEERYYQYNHWRWRSNDSYSTEHSWLGCGGILLSEQKIGDRYLGWHKSYGLILFNSCTDYEKLNRGRMSFSSDSKAIFDVFIK